MIPVVGISRRDQRAGVNDDQRLPNSARRISSERAVRAETRFLIIALTC
jgi:hypothetical protein